ncbi:MAG: PDZ domain-containing protein [Candidatus Glassbacteria bacterium]|nr:PDZ domain-containing protein [Candidatus Glassbacteria bacterium]
MSGILRNDVMGRLAAAIIVLVISVPAAFAQDGGLSGAMQAAMSLNAAFQETASKVTPSVVSISSSRPRRRAESGRDRVINMGSGVIVTGDGYLLTNNHVITRAEDIQIMLLDGRTYEAEVVGTDHTTDLAVLKVKDLEPGTRLPAISFGDSDSCNIGAWVLAIGNPMELGISVTAGIISAKSRKIDILSGDPQNIQGNVDQSIESFIQTDAVINPGNSGGALVSLQGDLIGINTALASKTGLYQGYGFAIPVNLARRVMEDLIAYGRVIRPVLGVVIQGLDPVRARALGLKNPQGVLIEDFSPSSGSPAELGGVRRGDVILEVEGQLIRFSHQLQETIAKYRPGDEIEVTVFRDGNRLLRRVRLGSKEISGSSRAIAAAAKPQVKRTPTLGLQLRELNEHDFDVLEIQNRRGVFVERVSEGGLAAMRGIRAGDVLLSIDRTPVNSVQEVQDLLEDIEPGSASLFMVLRDGTTHFIGIEIP